VSIFLEDAPQLIIQSAAALGGDSEVKPVVIASIALTTMWVNRQLSIIRFHLQNSAEFSEFGCSLILVRIHALKRALVADQSP
jgi:hypothetical protein